MKGIREEKPQRNYNYKHLETCFFSFFMKEEVKKKLKEERDQGKLERKRE